MNVGILTCARLPELLESDQKLIPLFHKHSITAKAVIWDDESIDWTTFDYLLFRNTWDYYQKEAAFNDWLQKIESLGIKTLNPIATIQQNKHKFYLKELENKGVLILPTIFLEKNSNKNLDTFLPKNWQKIVIKPAFSAGSYLTKLVDRSEIASIQNEFQEHLITKDFLLQEFRPEIKDLGETSFIFFNGIFSHAINKKPVEGDFRVQIQYGGLYTIIDPTTELINQAQAILNQIQKQLLYARIDGIVKDKQLHLMEIELIEPDLYFDIAIGSRERFLEAFLKVTE